MLRVHLIPRLLLLLLLQLLLQPPLRLVLLRLPDELLVVFECPGPLMACDA
jgi:hypothetical protein